MTRGRWAFAAFLSLALLLNVGYHAPWWVTAQAAAFGFWWAIQVYLMQLERELGELEHALAERAS